MGITRRQFICSASISTLLTTAWQSGAQASVKRSSPKPGSLRTCWGDQGDGYFVNPVLPADYSDIDVIRVGDRYVAISSTIHVVPGMVILQSNDLVNWRTTGHAVPDVSALGPELSWKHMAAAGRGIWAGAIRFHADRYWIYFTCPDSGIFLTTAPAPEGPWSPLQSVLAAPGYDDPCPFWDDDGRGYLVTTHFAYDPKTKRDYDVHLFTLDGEGLLASPASRIIHHSKGSEANKLYRIGGHYFHYYSEVRPEGRTPMIARAQSLNGPWEQRQLLHVDPATDKEPNQGGLVDAPDGSWWFLTHQGTGDWEGRAMCLLPVAWHDDWPVIGEVGTDGIGNMVWRSRKPIFRDGPQLPLLSDDFDASSIAPRWEWNHAPRDDMWSLAAKPGCLRLHAFPSARPQDLVAAGNTISQRAWRTARNRATALIDVALMAPGQKAGIIHFASGYAALGVEQIGDRRTLVFRNSSGTLLSGRLLAQSRLWIRSEWGIDGTARASYSLDGIHYEPFGPPFHLAWGHYRGDRIGIFSVNEEGTFGSIDVEAFEYLIADQIGRADLKPDISFERRAMEQH